MKLSTFLFLAVISPLAAQPQQQNPRDNDSGRQPGQGGHRPPPPLVAVLDADHDGTISAEEIENASTALKQLDKNGDGELTREELGPPPRKGPEKEPDSESKGQE